MKNIVINKVIFSDIFGSAETHYPRIHNFLQKKKGIRILELGSGVPVNLFLAYHVYNPSAMIFVDVASESKLISNYKTKNLCYSHPNFKKLAEAKSFYDIYSLAISPDETCLHQKITTKSDFDDIFQPGFRRKRVHDFFENNEETFDIIVASNILHFYKDLYKNAAVLAAMNNSLSSDGLLLIRVQEKPDFDMSDFKKRLSSEFSNLVCFDYFDGEIYNHSIIVNKASLFSFAT